MMLHDLVQRVFAFVNKLKLFKTHLQNEELTPFLSVSKARGQAPEAVRQSTASSFEVRFHDLQLKRPHITILFDFSMLNWTV